MGKMIDGIREKFIPIIAEYLVMVLMKLVKWEKIHIKYSCNKLKKMAIESTGELVYGYFHFNTKDIQSLNVIQQFVMMKKNDIIIKEINFLDEKLGEMANLLLGVENSLLKTLQKKEVSAFKNEYGVLFYL